jgi:hypothetical protein
MYFWGILPPPTKTVGSVPGHQKLAEKWYFYLLAYVFLGYSRSTYPNRRIINKNHSFPEKWYFYLLANVFLGYYSSTYPNSIIFHKNPLAIKGSWKNNIFIYLQMYFWDILAPPTQTLGSLITPGNQGLTGKRYFYILADVFCDFTMLILIFCNKAI